MKVNMNMDFYGLQMHQFMIWIQTNAIENFVNKYTLYDNNKLALNFREFQTRCHKKTCWKKNQAIC
jgi:hypothetical protein